MYLLLPAQSCFDPQNENGLLHLEYLGAAFSLVVVVWLPLAFWLAEVALLVVAWLPLPFPLAFWSAEAALLVVAWLLLLFPLAFWLAEAALEVSLLFHLQSIKKEI